MVFKKLSALIGFISSFPFFLIPSADILYLNKIRIIDFHTQIHPDYTFSLGLAVPICLLTLVLMFFIVFMEKNLIHKKDLFLLGALVVTALYLLAASNSIKSVAFSASLFSFYLAFQLSTSTHGRFYLEGYVKGFITFLILHAISLIFYGFSFSKKTEGISIFTFEIYQALVSYSASITLFFGVLLLYPQILNRAFEKKSNGVRIAVWIIILAAIIIIEMYLMRRSAFLLLVLALILYFNKQTANRLSLKFRLFLMALIFAATVFLAKLFLFKDEKSIDFLNMISPRWELYKSAWNELSSSSIQELIFGQENSWAVLHNSFLDVLKHSGLMGLMLSGLCVILLGRMFRNAFDLHSFVKQGKNYPTIFIVISLVFDNLVNTMFSLPLYSVPAAILLVSVFTLTEDPK